MSTDADHTDAHRIPSIPPQPPHRPSVPQPASVPLPEEDPQTTVLRPVPADPTVPPPAPPASRPTPPAPAAPPRPAAPPTAPPPAPPRPRTAPPAAPPLPPHAPAAAPPPAPAAPPVSFRDTAAFHLAKSQELWNGGPDGAPATAPGKRPARSRAGTGPSAAPGSAPPTPDAERPAGAPWSRTPFPRQGFGPAPRMPAAPPRGRPGFRLPGARLTATAACLVLGVGLIGGAVAGSMLTEDEPAAPTPAASFTKGRDAWHNTPVNTLFPRTLDGLGVGPGGSDRHWTRIAVAPDSGCAGAYDPKLAKALAPVGCARLLRATYTDATRTDVITVGAQIATGGQKAMMALNTRFSTDSLGARTDLMPLPYAAKDTPAASFGRTQRASWTVRILTDIPVVVFAVSGFADGRAIDAPQPAEAAVREGATTAPAESGLGHAAKDLADLLEASFRKASGIPTEPTETTP